MGFSFPTVAPAFNTSSHHSSIKIGIDRDAGKAQFCELAAMSMAVTGTIRFFFMSRAFIVVALCPSSSKPTNRRDAVTSIASLELGTWAWRMCSHLFLRLFCRPRSQRFVTVDLPSWRSRRRTVHIAVVQRPCTMCYACSSTDFCDRGKMNKRNHTC